MQLRNYQIEAVNATFDFFTQYPDATENPVIAMPTGTGKAVVIAAMVKRIMMQWPSQRIMMLTHVKELIEQNADKLKQFWPQAPLGIYSAGLGSKDHSSPIIFAGIQSAAKYPELFGHIDLILIDECHLVSPNDNAAYQTFIKALRDKNPFVRVVGYSATPYRLSLGMITDGGVFTKIAYDMTSMQAFNWLIDEGYLSPLVPMPTAAELNVDGVHKRGGEFIDSELQERVVKYDITKAALLEAMEVAHNRNHWLIYATGIDHVKMIEGILNELGVSCACVHSNSKKHKMSDYERDDNLARFKAGQIRALINADILTTGFDFPALDCIILLRPTNSPGLHVQILGRGTRPFYAAGFDLSTKEGRLAAIAASVKQSCLVLDFAGNTRRLGPINDPRIPGRKKAGGGDMPLKVCPDCGCLNHISARICVNPECGHEFVFETKIDSKASTMALIVRDEPQVEVFKVDRVVYDIHEKRGSVPSLKVSYYAGIRRFTEWVPIQHHEIESVAVYKAQKWWRERDESNETWDWDGELKDVPKTAAEANAAAPLLKVPSHIRVWVNKRYPEILAHIFDKESEDA